MNWEISALLIFVVVKSQLIDHLQPHNFTAKAWNLTVQKLNETKSIHFGSVPLTEDQMTQVLSLQLPNLEQIFFRTAAVKTVIEARKSVSTQTLTPKLLQLLFESHFFEQLKVLDLSGTNIEDRHLQFLVKAPKRVAALETLRLQDCLISRDGLALLGKTLKAGSLLELSLRNTLLVEKGSAETLLQLLCVFNEGRCSSPILALDLSNSNIRVRELESLLLALDTSALQSLSLNQVTLIFDHATAQVDYRALRAFAQASLLQLEELNLRNTFLDDQAARIIGTISLPNLLQLSVSKNRIGYNGMANLLQFETKPKLQGLEVQENLIDDEVIDIIIKQKFALKRLSATILSMYQDMQAFRTNILEELRLTTKTEIYRTILTYCDLQNLLWMEITFSDYSYLTTSSQEKIEINLNQEDDDVLVDLFNQFDDQFDEQDTWVVNDDADDEDWSDQFDEWLLEDKEDQEQSDWQITDDIPVNSNAVPEDIDYNELFPIYRLRKLKHLKLINFFYIQQWCYKPLQKNFNNPKLRQVSLQTSSAASVNLQYFHRKYPNLKHFQIKLDNEFQKITVDFQSLREQMYSLRFYLGNIEGRYQGSNTFVAKKYHVKQVYNSLDQWMWYILGFYYDDQDNTDDWPGIVFDYTQVQNLKVKDIKFFEELSPSGRFTDIRLPLLKQLCIKDDIEVRDAIKLVLKTQMPILESLDFSLKSEGAQPEVLANFMRKLSVFRNLRTLRLRFNIQQSKIRDEYYGSLFKGLFFPKIESIDLGRNNLETQHIAELISMHNMTLRSIDLSFNFIERDFFSLLRISNITLTELRLDNSYITLKDFLQLAEVNTYFIEVFSIPSSDLTDLHFSQMMDLKQREFSTRLRYLNIYGNDVRNEALSTLFRGGMDHLSQISEEKTREKLNVLLKYPHQLKVIYSQNIYGGKIEKVSNITSIWMNQLIIISIQSEEDLLRLGKLPFPSLRSLTISLYNIYDCTVLEAVLNISQRATKEVIVNIYNEEVGLNSKCLSVSPSPAAKISTQSFQLNDHFSTTSLEQFAQIFISSKMKSLKLKNTLLPTSAIRSLLSADYTQLSFLAVPSNYFGEALASRISEKTFPFVYLIDLSFNNLTEASTQTLSYLLSHYEVELQGNRLGPDFCRQLNVKDKSFALNVKRCGLRKDCLDNLLENQNIQNIKSIDLSYNQIDEFQILEFILKAKIVFKKLKQVHAYGISISQDTYLSISKTTIYTSSNYEFDQIKFKNAAKY